MRMKTLVGRDTEEQLRKEQHEAEEKEQQRRREAQLHVLKQRGALMKENLNLDLPTPSTSATQGRSPSSAFSTSISPLADAFMRNGRNGQSSSLQSPVMSSSTSRFSFALSG